MNKFCVRIILMIATSVVLCGCFESAVEKAANELDRHIYTLQNESGDWRATLQQSVTDLQKAGQTTLANEVQNVLTRSISATGEEGRFDVDFLRSRSEQVLRNAVSVLRGGKDVYISPPAIGSWTPTKVDLYLPPERRTSLEFSGYDLANKAKDGTGLRLLLVMVDDSTTDVSRHIYQTTFYHAVVNTSGSGIQFTPNSKSLRLVWDGKQLSEIPVLIPRFSWHRNDVAGNVYSKTFSFISENMDNVKGGKLASGQFNLGIPDARIYRVDFRHEGDGAPWNYHPSNPPPHNYDGCTELLDGGKGFKWTRKWGGKPTTEYYTAFYEIWQAD